MPRLAVFALAVAAVALGTTLAAAEPPPPAPPDNSLVYQPPAWPEPPNLGAMVTRLALGTVFVLALCAGTLWAGQRWLGGPVAPKSGGPRRLRLVEAIPLQGSCRLSLLKVDNCEVLVAVDSAGLKEMAILSEPFLNAFGRMEEGADLKMPSDLSRLPLRGLTAPPD